MDYSTTYTYSAANAGLVGQALTIRFLEIDNAVGRTGGEVDIDNVRLVPEPSAASLIILSAGALLALKRRRGAV